MLHVIPMLNCGNDEATDVEYTGTVRENVCRINTAMHDLPLTVVVDHRFWSGLALRLLGLRAVLASHGANRR